MRNLTKLEDGLFYRTRQLSHDLKSYREKYGDWDILTLSKKQEFSNFMDLIFCSGLEDLYQEYCEIYDELDDFCESCYPW